MIGRLLGSKGRARERGAAAARPRHAALRLVGGLGAILWLALLAAAYFVVHKPLAAETLPGIQYQSQLLGRASSVLPLLGALWAGLVTLWLGLLATALGRVVIRRDDLLGAAGIGLGLLSILVLGLGLLGLIQPWLLAVLGLAASAALSRSLLWAGRGVGARLRLAVRGQPGETRGEALLRWFIVATLALVALAALAPVTGWDSLAYHVTGPRRFLELGRIAPGVLHGAQFYFPWLGEMLFLPALALGGEIGTRLIHVGFLILAVLATYRLGADRLGRRGGLLAAALALSVWSLLFLGAQPYVDAIALFYVTLGLWYALAALERGDRAALAISAGCAGLALGVKYTCLGAVAGLGLVVLGQCRRQPKRAALWLLVVAAVMAPWYLKNWAFTGNPTYPFAFNGWEWDSFRTAWYGRPASGLAYAEPWRLLVAPLEATVLGVEGGRGYAATIGPLLVGLLPLTLLAWRRRPASPAISPPGPPLPRGTTSLPPEAGGRGGLADRLPLAGGPGGQAPLAVLLGVASLFWWVGLASSTELLQTRLLFPAFGALAVLVAAGLQASPRLDVPALRASWVLSVGTGVALATLLATQVLALAADSPLPYLLGAESRRDYLARHTRAYADEMDALTALPAGSRVLFLWEPRSFDCPTRVDCRPDVTVDHWGLLRHRGGDAAGIAAYLKAQGITHVLVAQDGLNYLTIAPDSWVTPADLATLRTLEQTALEPVAGAPVQIWGLSRAPSGPRYGLYRIEQ